MKLESHTLDNGLRVALQPDDSLPLVAVNLWYHVGSKDEKPGRTGLAHLFEHMLFQGSQHVGTNDHFRHIQEVGGVANGSTWYDRTNYFETLPANQLDLGLWLESDRMGYLLPALTQRKLDTQREVVLNERLQTVENRPYGLALERLHEELYPNRHTYHWPVIGYPDDLASASLGDLEDFFNSYYSPNNAVLTLAGDFVPQRALDRIKRYFGDLPPGKPSRPMSPPAISLGTKVRRHLEDDVELERVYIGYSIPPVTSESRYTADLLASILCNGKSSLMYRDLVYSRQLAQDVTVMMLPMEIAATLLVVATAKPGIDLDDLIEALDEHLDNLASRAPTESRVERARDKILTAHHDELQEVGNRADLISQGLTYFDDPAKLLNDPAKYSEVSPRDIQDFASQHLGQNHRVTITVGPRNSAV
ncbi:MAG: pitrilysin family protein [Thermoanaerobaculia bacterium]